jgi:hypothetical protein
MLNAATFAAYKEADESPPWGTVTRDGQIWLR